MRRPRLDRLLSLSEVADLMQLALPKPSRRRERVARWFRRLERSHKRQYLIQQTPGGKLFVKLSTVDELLRWDPNAVQQIRRDLDDLSVEVRDVRKAQGAHGARIRNLEKFKRATAQYLAVLGEELT